MDNVKLIMSAAVAAATLALAWPAAACPEGCEEPPPPEETAKGNNGWGNGPDTTNNGSFSGGSAVTKDNNGLNQPRLGPVPAVVDKFTGR